MKGKGPVIFIVAGLAIGGLIAGCFFFSAIGSVWFFGSRPVQAQASPTSTQIPTSTPIGVPTTNQGGDIGLPDFTPGPTRTATATRTATRTPTVAVAATQTATKVPATPTPTVRLATPTPTKTATPAPPTKTATPANTPTPVATATPSIPYSPQGISWEANCGMIRIKLFVGDASGNPVNGIVLRYETVDGVHTARSNPTGQPGVNEPGWTDFTVSNTKQVATWRVWVVDDSDSALSAKVDVTTTDDCLPGSGHQVATVRFKKNY